MTPFFNIVRWFIQGRPIIDNIRYRNKSLMLVYGLIVVYFYVILAHWEPDWAFLCLLPLFGAMIAYWIFSGLRWYVVTTIYLIIASFAFGHLASANIAKLKILFTTEFDAVDVKPSDFPWLDEQYFDAESEALQKLGFRFLADWAPVPHNKAFPEMETMIRCLTNEEKSVVAVIGQIRFVKPRNAYEKDVDIRVVQFSTEFSDGLILNTTNSQGLDPIESAEGFVIRMFPPETKTEPLLDLHVAQLKELLADPSRTARTVSTKEELFAVSYREHVLMSKDRLNKGLLTDEEVGRITAIAGLADASASQYLKSFRQHAGSGESDTKTEIVADESTKPNDASAVPKGTP